MSLSRYSLESCNVLTAGLTGLTMKHLPRHLNEFQLIFILRYDEKSSLWKAENPEQPFFLATSAAAKRTLLLGPHNWTLYNDSCSNEKAYTTTLVLSSCNEDEFTCSDAMCVTMSLRCDGKKDCEDGTDEAQCQAFIKYPEYNKFLVPSPLGHDDKLIVNMSLIIQEILGINENEGYILTKVEYKRTWYDSQLKYQNIKRFSENMLSPSELEYDYMWKPWTINHNIANKGKMVAT